MPAMGSQAAAVLAIPPTPSSCSKSSTASCSPATMPSSSFGVSKVRAAVLATTHSTRSEETTPPPGPVIRKPSRLLRPRLAGQVRSATPPASILTLLHVL